MSPKIECWSQMIISIDVFSFFVAESDIRSEPEIHVIDTCYEAATFKYAKIWWQHRLATTVAATNEQ